MKGKLLRKIFSMTMALTVMAGIACSTVAMTSAAEADVVPLTAVQGLTNESTISSDVISYGKSVTVYAKASGGTGGYTYSVLYRKKSDSNWTTKQKFTENAKVVIKPAKETEYELCVKVRDSSGKIVKKYFTFKVNPELKNNSVISKTTVIYGESLKVYGRAEGGVGKYMYAVYYKKSSDTKWTAKQNYSRNTVVSIKPAKAVKYNVCVKIKDEQGTVVKKYLDFTVKADELKEIIRLTNEERQKAGAAENIAYAYPTPEKVMAAWMKSEGHKANILDSDFTHIGVGLYEKDGNKYWVQIFATL